jgi:hypothetical protein
MRVSSFAFKCNLYRYSSTEIPGGGARLKLFLIYLPYLIIPAMIAFLLAHEEKPFGKAGDAGATTRSKSKRR